VSRAWNFSTVFAILSGQFEVHVDLEGSAVDDAARDQSLAAIPPAQSDHLTCAPT
jgi:hypothetical protein